MEVMFVLDEFLIQVLFKKKKDLNFIWPQNMNQSSNFPKIAITYDVVFLNLSGWVGWAGLEKKYSPFSVIKKAH